MSIYESASVVKVPQIGSRNKFRDTGATKRLQLELYNVVSSGQQNSGQQWAVLTVRNNACSSFRPFNVNQAPGEGDLVFDAELNAGCLGGLDEEGWLFSFLLHDEHSTVQSTLEKLETRETGDSISPVLLTRII